MDGITRLDSNERLSRVVIHADKVYLSGLSSRAPGGIEAQTREVLSKIDHYLSQGGTDKTRILTAQIWLANIARDFAGMNAIWAEWLPADARPARATCQAGLAAPEILVEMIVTAVR